MRPPHLAGNYAPVTEELTARDLTAGVADTHVVRHAGRTLALVESSFPHELHLSGGGAPLRRGSATWTPPARTTSAAS
jgi:hypothetical protein